MVRADSRSDAPLIAFTVMFVYLLCVPRILSDDDTIWHIATGNWILHHGAVPHVDLFSYTKAGQRWFAQEWLSEVLMALADRAAGLRGVMILTALSIGATAGLLLSHMRQFMAPPLAVLVMIVGIGCGSGSMLARPHALAWPVLELWCAGLVIARARRQTPSWWLLPIMGVWANLHGGFIIGIALSAALALEAVWEAGAAWRKPALIWSLFIAAAVGVTLLNPNGWEGLLFPLKLLRMHSLAYIQEWQPTNFAKVQPLEMVILLFLALGLSGRLQIPQYRLLLFLLLFHEALNHARHNQILGLMGSLLLAEALGQLAPATGAGLSHKWAQRPIIRHFVTWRPATLISFALIALICRVSVPLERENPLYGLGATLAEVPPSLRSQPVLNEYSFGPRLIGEGIRPFIDSRADLYGDDFLNRNNAINALQGNALPEALAEFHIAWTIFPPDSLVTLWLDSQPGWRRLLSNSLAVVHVRQDEPGQQAARLRNSAARLQEPSTATP